MAITLRWVGLEESDRVALTRLRCYGAAASELNRFKADFTNDQRAEAGDYLLADDSSDHSGESIGTVTSLSMHMWMRGSRIPCQGVAFVGTIRTARRGGVAKQLMEATLAKAREREQVATALMPFRATFYERFGYGFAERRTDWTVPLSLMPSLETAGLRYATADDRQAIISLRQRAVEQGQCDIETSAAGWALRDSTESDGFMLVDGDTHHLRSWALITTDHLAQGRFTALRVSQFACDSSESLARLLAFLGGQRDQYATALLTLPTGLPLNRLLRETQIPHRLVSHPYADAKPYTRMQIRILDHRRLLHALHLQFNGAGAFTLGVQECDGELTRLKIEMTDGRIVTRTHAGDCDVMCADRIWASIVSGDLSARVAVSLGLMQCSEQRVVDLLDAFSAGPTPFCNEYF